MNHPSLEVLALFSSGDLPLFDRWKVQRHVGGCERCDRQTSIFRAATAEFKRQAKTETLSGFEAVVDWARLEREMEGNIVVGLAAARCVEPGPNHRALLIKFSLAAVLLLLFVVGWVTHVPPDQSVRLLTAVRGAFPGGQTSANLGPILRTQPDGIVVGSPEGSLTIFHPTGAVVSLSGPSSVEARYVDEETGQVTITDVYGQ